jgi:ribosome-associated translation inhibitor RaiA
MTIQFNTDKTINGDERNENHYTSLIEEELKRYQSHITRIEVHLTDENGQKDGRNDILCLLEARLEGRQPMAVSNQADDIEQAVSGALDKLKVSLDTILGRIQNH